MRARGGSCSSLCHWQGPVYLCGTQWHPWWGTPCPLRNLAWCESHCSDILPTELPANCFPATHSQTHVESALTRAYSVRAFLGKGSPQRLEKLGFRKLSPNSVKKKKKWKHLLLVVFFLSFFFLSKGKRRKSSVMWSLPKPHPALVQSGNIHYTKNFKGSFSETVSHNAAHCLHFN